MLVSRLQPAEESDREVSIFMDTFLSFASKLYFGFGFAGMFSF